MLRAINPQIRNMQILIEQFTEMFLSRIGRLIIAAGHTHALDGNNFRPIQMTNDVEQTQKQIFFVFLLQ